MAAAEPTLARQRKRYRSRTGQKVFRELLNANDDRLRPALRSIANAVD